MVGKRYEYSQSELEEQDRASAPSLDLPSIKVEKFFMPRDGGKYMVFFVNVAKDHYPTECPYCHQKNCLTRSGRSKPRLVHDVTRNNYRVDIVYQPPRVECQNPKCGQRFTASVEGIDSYRQMTTRLLEYLQTECFLQSQTNLAMLSGLSSETISNIMDEEIDKFNKEREENPMIAPRVLGIDEKHINNKMRGTFVDIEKRLLLDMTEANDRESMIEAIKKLKDWDTNIEVVTTDMSNAYLRWLPELLPNATIVIDKFHVIQDVEKRVSKTKSELYAYRKNLISQIEDSDERARQQGILNILNDTMRLMNYSMESVARDNDLGLSPKLATVIKEFPEFKLLRKLYFLVELMYTKETREEAESVWDEWARLLPPNGDNQYKEWCDLYSVVPPLFDSFRSFSRSGFTMFKPFILNYFNRPDTQHTNAATEGLNNLIGSINSVGNGYSFKVLRAKCLYASLIYEKTTYSLSMSTIKTWTPTNSLTLGFDNPSGYYGSITKYKFEQRKEQTVGYTIDALSRNSTFVSSFKDESSFATQMQFSELCEDSILQYADSIVRTEFGEYDDDYYGDSDWQDDYFEECLVDSDGSGNNPFDDDE